MKLSVERVRAAQFRARDGDLHVPVSEVFVGYTAISRDELPDMPRLSRVVIEKIDSSKENLCKQARIGTFFDIDEIPEVFADLLRLTVA